MCCMQWQQQLISDFTFKKAFIYSVIVLSMYHILIFLMSKRLKTIRNNLRILCLYYFTTFFLSFIGSNSWLVSWLLSRPCFLFFSGSRWVHNISMTFLPNTMVWLWPWCCFLHQLPLFFHSYVTWTELDGLLTQIMCKCVCAVQSHHRSSSHNLGDTSPSGFILIIVIRQYHRSANT